MKALILAGGLGTRLRPLTYTRPKHLLPIANRPHVEHVLDLLSAHAITDVVLATSYLAEAFSATVEAAARRGVSVEVTQEAEPLGTGGAIKNAEGLVGGDTFLAFNGDVLTDVDLTSVVAFHRAAGAQATILLTPVEDPSAFGVVPTDPEGRVLGFIEKPRRDLALTNLVNAGVYVLEPSVLARMPPGEVWSVERQLFPGMVEEGGGLYAMGTEGYWMDIGTPDKYLQANLDALSGRYTTSAVPRPGEAASCIAPEASVGPRARVSSSCVGRGAVIEDGASIVDSVILPGAMVSQGASVVRSILGEAVTVAPGVSVAQQTIADGQEVKG